MAKAVKFSGIIGIILLHLAYEKKPAVKAILRPPLRILLLPAELFAGIVGGVFLAISWPFRAAWKALRAK